MIECFLLHLGLFISHHAEAFYNKEKIEMEIKTSTSETIFVKKSFVSLHLINLKD